MVGAKSAPRLVRGWRVLHEQAKKVLVRAGMDPLRRGDGFHLRQPDLHESEKDRGGIDRERGLQGHRAEGGRPAHR